MEAGMLLYDSFVSLNAPELVTSFQDIMLQRSDLVFAMKKAVASYRCLGNAEKIAEYKHFLATCERELEGIDETPLLQVIINDLADTDDLVSNEIASCEKLTQLFLLNFQNQYDVAGIVSLARTYVDRPKAFAAFFRCMLLRGMTHDKILSSYQLQDFFRYHLSSLNQKNNPIEQLYRLFNAFPETLILSTQAKTVCCKEGELSAYALDGSSQLEAGRLIAIPFIPIPLELTYEADNLKTLHIMFGVDFLMSALSQWGNKQNDNQIIKILFNQESTVNTQLAEVANRVHENTFLQRALANLLTDETLSLLIERHVVGILNLIPFCPILATFIQERDLSVYLHALRQQASSELVLISSLFTLFLAVKKSDTAAAKLVFNALLDSILTDPSVIDDMRMIGKLRKFSHVSDCVVQKAQMLQVELDAVIRLHTQESIKAMDYITIEDVCRDGEMKIRHLQKIIPFKTTYPVDKYKLYSLLARTFVEKNDVFNLDDFTTAIGLDAVFELQAVTPYERLIIELLATIDNDKLRAQCIQILDREVARPWRTHSYGNVYLFTQAVLAGNLGLVRWMDANKIKSIDSRDELVIAAADVEQWPVVAWFHARYRLPKNILDQLLHKVITQGYSGDVLMLFSNDNHYMPTRKAVDAAFKLAVKLNDVRSVICFTKVPLPPSDTIVAHAFKMAIKLKYFDLSRVIANEFSGACLRAAIDQTMKDAALQNSCDVLETLATFSNYHAEQKVMESALMGATRANQLGTVKWLANFSTLPFQSDFIQKARKEAHRLHLTDMSGFLLTLCPQPQPKKRTASCLRAQTLTDKSGESNPERVKRTTSCSAVSNLQAIHQHGFFKNTKKFSSVGDFTLTAPLENCG